MTNAAPNSIVRMKLELHRAAEERRRARRDLKARNQELLQTVALQLFRAAGLDTKNALESIESTNDPTDDGIVSHRFVRLDLMGMGTIRIDVRAVPLQQDKWQMTIGSQSAVVHDGHDVAAVVERPCIKAIEDVISVLRDTSMAKRIENFADAD